MLMPEFVSACPLCSEKTSSLFDQRPFHGRQVTNVICRNCGLVYQSPRMSAAERQSFYEAGYRLLYQGQSGPSAEDLAVQQLRATTTLGLIENYGQIPARALDIGCSAGILLQQLREHFRAQVIGVEPGNSYRQFAQAAGLLVFASLEQLERDGRAPFDLISMMHVLEHLPEPVDYLVNLRQKHLTPHGYIVLEVPNLYAHDCFEVAHLVSYSPHSLVQVVQKAGFRVMHLRAHGQPRSKLIPLYLTMIARPDESISYTLKPDRLVHLKRQAGFFYRRAATRFLPKMAWLSPENPGS